MTALIRVENVSVRFRIYRNRYPSLKDLFVNSLVGLRRYEGYKEFYALRNISLVIKPGERVGLLGLNGAGKSTLLKTIARIYSPHIGNVHVKGRVTPLMELGAGFDLEQTGRENIYLIGALLGISPEQMREKEKAIAEFSELIDFLDLPVKYYSSGMYNRLAFSIAAITDPEVLLMDETFATGDAHFVEKSKNRVLHLVEKSQLVLFVSHNLSQVVDVCNRAIVLHKGEILSDGQPSTMVRFYEELVRREFKQA